VVIVNRRKTKEEAVEKRRWEGGKPSRNTSETDQVREMVVNVKRGSVGYILSTMRNHKPMMIYKMTKEIWTRCWELILRVISIVSGVFAM
jgi:hypothetical protein